MKRGRTVDHFGADRGAKIEYTGCTGSFGEGTKIAGGGGVSGTTTAISAAGNAAASSA